MKIPRIAFVVLCLLPAYAQAHKASDSFLTVESAAGAVTARLDLALLDLEHAIGIDGDGNGDITWGEVQDSHDEIAAYALARLRIADASGDCGLRAGRQSIARHSDGAYTALPIELGCSAPSGWLNVEYALLFDVDPSHRALVRFAREGVTQTRVLAPAAPATRFTLGATDTDRAPVSVTTGEASQLRDSGNPPISHMPDATRWQAAADYFHEGVRHVWAGTDHVVFLLTLLLPVTLAAAGARRPAARVLMLVTTFTVAHSLTLAPAALGWITLPPRLVESAIAASVLLVAVANLMPRFDAHRLPVVFGFGLVHGLGFASALGDLGLPRAAFGLSLAAFNVGVEAGQLVIVAAAGPILWLARQHAPSAGGLLRYGSAAAAIVAGGWLIERWFEVTLFAA